MISTLEINQFRGLEHVKFENLGRANLIIGGNNTGKTSILEALVLLLGMDSKIKFYPTLFASNRNIRQEPVTGRTFSRHQTLRNSKYSLINARSALPQVTDVQF